MNKNIKYGFQEHLTQSFPSQIIVDLTQHCNLACIHCPHPIYKNSEHYNGTHLDVNIHKKLIDDISQNSNNNCQYIRYTANGETLLHPNFDEIILYSGKNSKTRINVTTNGHYLTNEKIDVLLKAEVSVIDISIDAFTDETYSKIRKNGILSIVKENVINLINKIDKINSNMKVVVSFVEQPKNIGESKEFKKYWEEKGADFVVIRNLHSSAGSKKNISKQLKNLNEENTRKPCLYVWERLTLTPDGHLAFCPADWVNGSHFVDFRTVSVKEAWQSSFLNKLRKAHLENDFKNFSFCGNCPDWINTKWPEEGNSYLNVMKNLVPNDLLD